MKWEGENASSLETAFLSLLAAHNVPPPKREYLFAKELGRRWRFDCAWPDKKAAAELEGGVWTRGRHVRGKGFEGDCDKMNAATLLGWRVLRLTASKLRQDPVGCIEMVQELLR